MPEVVIYDDKRENLERAVRFIGEFLKGGISKYNSQSYSSLSKRPENCKQVDIVRLEKEIKWLFPEVRHIYTYELVMSGIAFNCFIKYLLVFLVHVNKMFTCFFTVDKSV